MNNKPAKKGKKADFLIKPQVLPNPAQNRKKLKYKLFFNSDF